MTADPGWCRIGPDPAIARWAAAARTAARVAPPEQWRAGGTWDVGLEAVPNAADGRVGGVAFPWGALPLTPVPLHAAQVSTVLPGYPQPDGDAAAHRWRLVRDGAHLDGLLAEGPQRRRHIREPHAWILGLPLTDCDAGASPLVVWEGSPAVLRAGLLAALAPYPARTWGDIDITDAYAAARAQVFATCARVEVHARPGEALLLHRLMLHGVAPWATRAMAPAEGRKIAYLRPLLASVADWLNSD
jgi:hypothetical protein